MKLRNGLLGVLSLAAVAGGGCGGGSTNATGSAGSGGGASGAAGTTGAAGTSGGAGTSGQAGTSGAAGSAGTTGGAGTTGAGRGGTTGAAGSAGTTGSAGRGGTTGSAGRGGTTGSAGTTGSGGGTANAMMNFFVSSDTSTTANLGGLTGADARCQRLAAAVGQGSKTWHAYLSAASPATNARDRIGPGPYFNSQGVMLAADKDALHARSGDATLFIDENGARINGQWSGSPQPNQHDILTGSTATGMIMTGNTCGDWTATTGSSQVGHSDGLGPSANPAPPYNQWAGSHTGMCGNTSPGGGAGRIYCFVGN